MKAIVVGSGAGGATAARELALKGFQVTILEAGHPFSPLTHKVSWLSSLRGSFLLKDEHSIEWVFPHYRTTRSSEDLVIFRGVTEGGCTGISCGNMVPAKNGLKEIGLDLSAEFAELERSIAINPVPVERWRPLSQHMFDEAQKLGFKPNPTPKALNLAKCVGCGWCEVGCMTGAKWDSRRLYEPLLEKSISMKSNVPVRKVIVENGRVKGVLAGNGETLDQLDADVVVLSAGGIGTAQILRASGLPSKDSLWVDIVLTVGGVAKDSRMLHEPPMVWYAKRDHYILSPYFDLLSYWFHKPWKNVHEDDRVGIMIKLADVEEGEVAVDGTVTKDLTEADRSRLEEAKIEAKQIMESSGVTGPFTDGLLHGGHIGGTVALTKDDVAMMHPSWLPKDLWVADLSLMPRSQGLPTMMTAAALALKVAKHIVEEKQPQESLV